MTMTMTMKENRQIILKRLTVLDGMSLRLVTLQKQWTTIRRYSTKAVHTKQTLFSTLHLVHLFFLLFFHRADAQHTKRQSSIKARPSTTWLIPLNLFFSLIINYYYYFAIYFNFLCFIDWDVKNVSFYITQKWKSYAIKW